MIARLAQALQRVDELSPDAQEELAEQIEFLFHAPMAGRDAVRRSFAGIWRDLPDDMEGTLLRWRHEAAPTPPIDDELRWMEEE